MAFSKLSWIGVVVMMTMCSAAQSQTSSRELWESYLANPDDHPNIPNNSYAGYRHGEKPFPEPRVVADVKRLGAKGDGKTDDTEAFEKAIEQAKTAGGGAVNIPAGQYRLTRHLRLDADGIVLRGAGSGRTQLGFERPLTQTIGEYRSGSSRGWSWCGGMIWIGPRYEWEGKGSPSGNWEQWESLDPISRVTSTHTRGERIITVDSPSALKAGETYLMIWTDPADQSFVEHVGGHELMRGFDYGILAGADWRWPVEIESVDGDRVTLKQPIRVDIRSDWNVRFAPLGAHVKECGVEGVSIVMPQHPVARHLQDVGFNGIYINRALHCWARDIVMHNVDVGWGVAQSKNTTISGLKITGQANHHATACRGGSHDNLVERFEIESRPFHGINTEGMSSGNVWRAGVMRAGTFDSHRLMSFDLIRTDITINNSGRPGGANHFGPFLGRRCVHWNIRGSGSGEWIAQPDGMSMGALVGIQGVPIEKKNAWAMPTGDKGTLIIDAGKTPQPVDLYQAQLEHRLKGTRTPPRRR